MTVRPLRRILSLQSALIASIPFLFVAMLGVLWVLPQIQSDVETHQRELARAVEGQLESYLSSSLNEVRAIASLHLEDPAFGSRRQMIVDDQLAASRSLKLLYAINRTGYVQTASIARKHTDREHRELEGTDLSATPLYREALQKNSPVWSDSFHSIIDNGLSVAVAVPSPGLVTVGEIDLGKLTEFLHRIAIREEQQIFIIDRHGQIIADAEGSYTARQLNIGNIPLVKRGLASKEPMSDRFDFHGITMVGSLIECPTVRWDVLVFQPAQSAYRSALTTGGIIIAGLLVSLLLGISAALVMARRLSQKIETLADNARNIARGETVTGWPATNIAEIRQLAGDLQVMAESISEREQQLRLNAVQFEHLYALSRMGNDEENRILDFTLEAAVQITASKIGYIYFCSDDESELTLHAWSRNVMDECTISMKPAVYKVAETGLWGEAVRHRSPVITNDYSSPNPLKNGYPEGHAPLRRHMNIPLIDNGKIVIVAGIGNKDAEYDDGDVQRLTILMGAMWRIIQEKRARKLLQESEERYRQLVAQNDDAIILLNRKNMRIIDANPAALALFGVDRDGLSCLLPRQFIDKNGLRKFVRSIPRRDITAGFMMESVNCFRAGGEKIIVSLKGNIIHLGKEEVLFCSIRDTTEKIRLQEEIRMSQAKLIQANKMSSLGMLVSSVAHEINNPNQCIAINTSVLSNIWRDAATILEESCDQSGTVHIGGLPLMEARDMVPQLFTGIAESSKRINTIIANLRDFVRSGRSSRSGSVDVNRAISTAIAILWQTIKKHTGNFRQELAENLPPAQGDPQQVEQVIINLVINALQSLPDKSRGITIGSFFEDASGMVVISIRDEGMGMDRKTLQRLSEPFFTTREHEGGTGLGLYISSSIVREYKGFLSFDSEPGKGTTASIRLPVAARSEPA